MIKVPAVPPILRVGRFEFVPAVSRTPDGMFEYDGKYAVHGCRTVAREVIEKFAADTGVRVIEVSR